MSIKVQIQDETSGDEPHVYNWFGPTPSLSKAGLAFSVINPKEIWTEFSAAARSSAGTTVIATAPAKGSLILTDLIIGTDKVNNATIAVRFNDGTRSVNLFSGVATDAPINFSVTFGGRVRGWADANLELVTAGALEANVTAVYYKSTGALEYDVWDYNR